MNKNYKPDYQHYTIFFQKNNANLHFVLEKIVSLQLENRSSDFCYEVLSVKSEKFQKGIRVSQGTLAAMRVNLFVPTVISQNHTDG